MQAERIYRRKKLGGGFGLEEEAEKEEDIRGRPPSYTAIHGVRVRSKEVRKWKKHRGQRVDRII